MLSLGLSDGHCLPTVSEYCSETLSLTRLELELQIRGTMN